MAEPIVIPVIWDETDLQGGIRDAIKGVKELDGVIDDLNDSSFKANKSMADNIGKTNKALDDQAKSLKSTKVEGLTYSKALEGAADNINIMGVNLGGVIRNLKGKQAALKALVTGLGGTTKGLKLLRVALISTGIGAIIVLLGSLVAWFTKTQEGIDKVNQVLAGLGAAFDVVIDRAGKIGGILIGLVTGQKSLTEAWNEGKQAVSGMADEMAREAVEAAKLTGQLQQLKRSEDELNVKRAESRAEIKQLNLIAEDVTKSDKERAEAAKAAIAIETSLADERKRLLEDQLAAQKALDDQGVSTHSDLKEQRRLRTDIAQAAQESLELQTTLNNKLNTIQQQRNAKIAEEATRISELKDRYTELLESITETNEDNSAITDVEKLQLEIKRANDLLEEQRQEFIAVAEAAGRAPDEIAKGLEQFDKLQVFLDARLDFANARLDDKAVRQIEDSALKPLETDPLILKPTVTVAPEIEDASFSLDEFKSKILDALGITGDEAEQIQESLTSTFNSVLEIYSASIQARIAVLDEEIAKRRENRETLEEELERQEELEQEGFANSAQAKRDAIQIELEQENAAIEERDKLRKKEQQLQAITQLATQAASLITAGAQIFAAEGSKGAVGVAFAIAAIAAMIASFAKLKADAKKQATSLYTGGSLSDHIPSATKSDRHGKGYQIHDGDTGMPMGVFIGGKEDIMREELGEHKAFFRDMNLNPSKYKGVDMLAVARGRKRAINKAVNVHSNQPNVHYIGLQKPDGTPFYIKKVNGKTVERMEVQV